MSIYSDTLKRALSDSDIRRLIPGIKVFEYRDLPKLIKNFTCPMSFVLLYETSKNFGHWTSVYYDKKSNTATFFDPYGFSVDSELSFAPKKLRKNLNENYPYLTVLLNMWRKYYGVKLFQNKYDYQMHLRGDDMCGQWNVLYQNARRSGLTDQQFFTHARKLNDYDVAKLIR